uniref:Uncharacterized protein LOC104224486 isoform X2 n=1 Tax=Nicotiana sylvestris TaxID=4096 RepID=A0A1U7WB54_NICSY|nr:PREDICTED: uncharacterized protein LOC104224486 isoform X2 [Nicotiana sylvestris]
MVENSEMEETLELEVTGEKQGRSPILSTNDNQTKKFADTKLVKIVMEALNHFSQASRLVANMEKSSLFMAGVDEPTKEALLQQTDFSQGRLQVLNVVVFSIYNFWRTVFILPQSVMKETDRRCKGYLCGTMNRRGRSF